LNENSRGINYLALTLFFFQRTCSMLAGFEKMLALSIIATIL